MQNEKAQMLIIYYMAKVMSMKEQEDFMVRKIKISSSLNLMRKEKETKNMIIIGNKAYFDELDKLSYCINVTEMQCLEILENTRMSGSKAVFLRYRDSILKDRLVFKRTSNVDTLYTGLAAYPYLYEAIKLLYKNTRGNVVTYDDIKTTIRKIEEMPNTKDIFKSEWDEISSSYNVASLLNKKVKKLV